jgi:hypothetical protein
MIRDSGEKTQDMLVPDKMSLDVFDYESLHRYRNRMKTTTSVMCVVTWTMWNFCKC